MQKRRDSLLESVANTGAAFVLSNVVWYPVAVYVLRIPYHPAEGIAVVLIYTALSIARNYVVRRLFNRRAYRDLVIESPVQVKRPPLSNLDLERWRRRGEQRKVP